MRTRTRPSRRERLHASLQRLVLRTSRTPVRLLWRLLYSALERLLAILVRRHHPERSVYVAGGFASREPLYGISDLDLVIVTPTARHAPAGAELDAASEDWDRLRRRLRLPDGLVHAAVHEQGGLAAAEAGNAFTYGLDARSGMEPALYHGAETIWRKGGAGLLHGPGAAGPAAGWRLLAGPDRRLRPRPTRAEDRGPVAWLALQSWWRWTFDACLRPERPHVPYLCVKLISEPIRLLLWLQRGELLQGRTAPLEAAATQLPRFADAAHRALQLHGGLPRSPVARLDGVLPELLALSDEVAGAVTAQAFAAGATSVRLRGAFQAPILPGDGARTTLPLGDWRALCFWFPPDEALLPLDADPAVAADLVRAAREDDGHRAPALRRGRLLIEPTASIHERGLLRSVQCAASDPVSFAVVAGEETARFPTIPGWSIEAWARRAVAEHRAWLVDPGPRGPHGEDRVLALGKLLGAARAALLLESVRTGAPELQLTAAATASALEETGSAAGRAAGEAIGHYRRVREQGRAMPAGPVVALLDEVARMAPYRPGAPRVTQPAGCVGASERQPSARRAGA